MSENLTEDEIQRLKASKTTEEWNKVCDEVKAVRDGRYPPDWYKRIVLSGLMNQISSQFKEQAW